MTHGDGAVDAVTTHRPRETSLGVQEVVLLVDIKELVVKMTVLLIEFVVVAIGLVAHMAVLNVAEHIPLLRQMVGGLHEGTAIELVGVRVVIGIVAVGQILLAHVAIGDVVDTPEVVAVEVLEGEAAENVPRLVLVVHIPNETISMLRHAFLTHEVGPLDEIALSIVDGQAEFRQLVVRTKLLVVAVTVSVVQRGRGAPMVVQRPGNRQDVMVLPKVVGCFVPEGAIGHLVAVGHVVAIGILGEVAVRIVGQCLVERVVLAEASLPHILIGLDARRHTVGSVHQAQVVIAGGDTVPSLAGTLEVADVLVADSNVVAQPADAAIVGAAAAAGTMYETVGCCLAVGSVHNPVVPKQARREVAAEVQGIERAVAGTYLNARRLLGCSRLQSHRTAEGTVAIGRCAYTALYLDAAQQRTVAIHISPEHTLVLGRIKRHTVECNVDT